MEGRAQVGGEGAQSGVVSVGDGDVDLTGKGGVPTPLIKQLIEAEKLSPTGGFYMLTRMGYVTV